MTEFRRDVLKRIRDAGPAFVSRDIPDTAQVPWQSTGWTHNRNVTQMLEFLLMFGEIAIAGRRGSERVWDLAERVYPAGLSTLPEEEAERLRGERRLRSLGIARAKGPMQPMEPTIVGSVGGAGGRGGEGVVAGGPRRRRKRSVGRSPGVPRSCRRSISS